jgi:hypothetical protein
MNEDQVLMNDSRVRDPIQIAVGGLIRLADFPEMTQIEIVVRKIK